MHKLDTAANKPKHCATRTHQAGSKRDYRRSTWHNRVSFWLGINHKNGK